MFKINYPQQTKKGFTTFSSHKRGFTLIELMVAISITAILMVVGFTTYSQAQMRGRDQKRKQDLRTIVVSLELYHAKYGKYPCSSWATSFSGGQWITDNIFSGSSGCTSVQSFDQSFIKLMPVDPLNSSTTGQPWIAGQYIYGYYGYNQCTPTTDGQFYLLIAQLENPNDPDRAAVKNSKWCNGVDVYTPSGGAGFNSANSFIITSM